eukprot:129141_1
MFGLFLLNNGKVMSQGVNWCKQCGENNREQLEIPDNYNDRRARWAPMFVDGLYDIYDIFVPSRWNICLSKDINKRVIVWGENSVGCLGLGSNHKTLFHNIKQFNGMNIRVLSSCGNHSALLNDKYEL